MVRRSKHPFDEVLAERERGEGRGGWFGGTRQLCSLGLVPASFGGVLMAENKPA